MYQEETSAGKKKKNKRVSFPLSLSNLAADLHEHTGNSYLLYCLSNIPKEMTHYK